MWTDMTGCADAHLSTGNVMEGREATARVGEDLTVGASRYYAILIINGIIGCMQSKYLPSGDMSAGDLRVEVTLAANNDGVTIPAAGQTVEAKTRLGSDVEIML